MLSCRILQQAVIIIVIVTASSALSSHTPLDLPCNFDDIARPKDESRKSTNIKYNMDVKQKNGTRTKRSVMEEGEVKDGEGDKPCANDDEPMTRAKRSMMEADVYEPIRITMFIHDLDNYVDTLEVARLERVSRGAVSIIKKFLSGKF